MGNRLGLILLVLILCGCNMLDDKELSYSEVKAESTEKDVQEFTEQAKENGVYLYTDGDKKWYVLLSSIIVEQGDPASYFTDFNIETKNDSVNIYFKEKSTDTFSNKHLNNRILYEIKLNKKFDVINLFRNNKETHFKTITGREN